MLYYSRGSEHDIFSPSDIKEVLFSVFKMLGEKKKVLVNPPDYSRIQSFAGDLTAYTWEYYKDKLTDILPALGTHSPMSSAEINRMFGNIPKELFRIHNWKKDLKNLGEVPSDYVKKVSDGKVDYSFPVLVNSLLAKGDYDLVLSIGQVVPHEVAGMANYNKNILIGTGGRDSINKSHFLGAVYGMEKIMGTVNNPVRQVLNYASEKFLKNIPLVYIHTVIGKDGSGKFVVRGLYIGDDIECFHQASRLSLKINLQVVEKALDKVVVYLDPLKYKSAWLGNKAIYRTRMAIKDNGELIIIAPGMSLFGEDSQIDKLIRKYGYKSSGEIIEDVRNNNDLAQDLCAAAHLIHGSSEGRFNITYCPGKMNRQDIENVNFKYSNPDQIMRIYDPAKLKDGFNVMPGCEEIYYISDPATGLWSTREKLPVYIKI